MTNFSRHPDRKETPLEELNDLKRVMTETGHDFDVSFEGKNDEKNFIVTAGSAFIDEDVQQRFAHLTDVLVSHEISEGWASEGGSTGTIRFSAKDAPWLDADSDVEDWAYERSFDDLDDGTIEWDDAPSPSV